MPVAFCCTSAHRPHHLVQFCVEQRDAVKADVVVLGCSGWLRHLPDRKGFEEQAGRELLRKKVDALVAELEREQFAIERLTEQVGGYFCLAPCGLMAK